LISCELCGGLRRGERGARVQALQAILEAPVVGGPPLGGITRVPRRRPVRVQLRGEAQQ